jgi:hypothetical protein
MGDVKLKCRKCGKEMITKEEHAFNSPMECCGERMVIAS